MENVIQAKVSQGFFRVNFSPAFFFFFSLFSFSKLNWNLKFYVEGMEERSIKIMLHEIIRTNSLPGLFLV